MMNIHRDNSDAQRGFTLIELLVVIVIIGLLIGLLGVAFSGALGTSRRAATESLMRTISTGLQQFENDFNYLPPLIDGHKHAIEAISDTVDLRGELEAHRYHSVYSLTVYLLGVGELAPPDESDVDPDPNRHDGYEGPGFRDPGPDRSWGGARRRTIETHQPTRSGRVYGPYIDIGDGEGILRKAVPEDFNFPDGASANDPDFFADGDDNGECDLYVLTDRWDQAIRYYKGWPTRDPIDKRTTVRRIPVEVRSVASIEQHLLSPLPQIADDPTLDRDILQSPYALLSAGPDADFGDTYKGSFIENEMFFEDVGSDLDQEKLDVLERIRDNIRVTP